MRLRVLVGAALSLALAGMTGLAGCGSSGGGDGIQLFPEEGRSFIAEGQQPLYATNPPTSGPMVPNAPAPGFYTTVQNPARLVNALYRSNVVIYYDPARTSQADRDRLQAIAQANPGAYSGVVVTPRTDLTHPVVLTAWRNMQRLGGVDEGAIQNFLTRFLGKGPTTAAGTEPAPILQFPEEGRTHVPQGSQVVYGTDPPTSGNHYPSAAGTGFYTAAPAPGNVVHALEHSNIVIYYDPRVSEETLNSLKTFVNAYTAPFRGVLLIPRTDDAYPVIATAWRHMVKQPVYDRAQIQQFIDLYIGKGPENDSGH
jgi:hypothetical protein